MMEDTPLKELLSPRLAGSVNNYASINNVPTGESLHQIFPDTSNEALPLLEPPFIPDIRCHREPTIWSRLAHVIHARIGVIYATIASFCFAVTGALVYILSQDLDPYQINAMMVSYQLFLASFLMLTVGVPLRVNCQQLLWVFPAGVLVALTNYLYAFSCRYMIMSDVAAVTQVSIVFMGVLSFLILHDPFSIVQFVLALLAFAGVVCISKPTFIFGTRFRSGDTEDASGLDEFTGIVFALCSALCEAPSFIFMRKQGSLGVHPLQSTFITAFMVEVISIVLCTGVGEWNGPTSEAWLYSIGTGIFSFVTYLSLYAALARETATLVAIIVTFQMIVAFALQLIFFSVAPNFTSWIGGFLVLVAGIGTLASTSAVHV